MKSKNIPISMSSKIKVGLTIGDPAGIGPAIALKAIKRLAGFAEFTLIGDAGVMKSAGAFRSSGKRDIKFIDLKNVDRKTFKFGKIKAEYGRASVEYLDKAIGLLKRKEIDCLVTCPISKEAIKAAGYNYTGHTEYLEKKASVKNTVMMLINSELKFSLLTRHLQLRKVPANITQERLRSTILITKLSLKKLFGIKRPRIVICGLNPHASDNGAIGKEEREIIIPALKKIRQKGLFLDGPLSADVAIARMKKKRYDCAIAMYHDQALIPLKLTGAESGVNITLGLPFIRTSPLHGTAFDIAARPHLANPSSLIEAIKAAVKCTLSQRKN